MEQKQPSKEIHYIESTDSLKVIAHGLRMQLMHLLKYAKTVKELAEAVNITQTKLYYHINLLEEHGLIEVVDTNIVSGIIEKQYQAVARKYAVSHQLLGDENTAPARLLDTILASVRDDFERGYSAGLITLDPNTRKHEMLRTTVKMNRTDIPAFQEELVALIRKFDLSETGEEGLVHALTLIMLPVPMEADDE